MEAFGGGPCVVVEVGAAAVTVWYAGGGWDGSIGRISTSDPALSSRIVSAVALNGEAEVLDRSDSCSGEEVVVVATTGSAADAEVAATGSFSDAEVLDEVNENSASCVRGEGRRGVVLGRDHGLGREGVPAEVGSPLMRGAGTDADIGARSTDDVVGMGESPFPRV